MGIRTGGIDMCWLYVKKAGNKIKYDYMDKAQKHNDDGYGVAWYEDGLVKTYKTFDYNQFKGIIGALKKHTLVIHLRNTTKGNNNYTNLHPFDIPSGVLFHNGTISRLGNSTESDTAMLAKMINECDYQYIEDILPLIKPMVDDKINRLVFMEDNGRVTIVNEHLGKEEDGDWFSNDYHEKDEGWCRYTKPANKIANQMINKSSVDYTKKYKVFVYGTLKRGYGNHHLLKNQLYLGKAKTKQKWAMVGNGMPFPYVLSVNNLGYQVEGEVYMVDGLTLKALDRLEGVPTHYKKLNVGVIYTDDNSTDTVSMYVKASISGSYNPEEYISRWGEEA
jgi:gamma-glutamylcyclotransferase (GGCT)/AIG2-like uncharacterized protein YtfP